VFTVPALDLLLPGPLPLAVERHYSSAIAERDVGLGPGWSHSFAWSIEETRRGLVVVRGSGARFRLPRLDRNEVVEGPRGCTCWRDGDDRLLQAGAIQRRFAPVTPGARHHRLIRISDQHGNTISLDYDGPRLVGITDSVGRRVRVAWSDGHIQAFLAPRAPEGPWHAFFRYEYDARGDLTGVVDALGHRTAFAYQNGPQPRRMVRCTHRDGLTFHFRY